MNLFDEINTESKIYEEFRIRLIDSVSVTFSVFMILSIIPKVIVTRWFFFPDLFSIVVSLILIWTRLINDRFAKLAVFRLTILFSGYLALPVTCLFLKNNAWIMVPWIMNIFIAFKIEYGYKWALIPAFIGMIFCNFGMYYFEPIEPIIQFLPARIFSNFIPPFLCFFIVQYYEFTLRNELMGEIHKAQKKESVYRIIETLNNELKDPIQLAINTFKSARTSHFQDIEKNDKCEKSLMEMEQLLCKLDSLEKDS